MQTAMALLRAEALKLRGTKFAWLALGIPAITLVLHLALVFDRAPLTIVDPAVTWRRLLSIGWTFWLAFTLPLFIALAAAALMNLEHRGHQWKQLFAWPNPRWGVYAVKVLFGLAFVAVAFVVFSLGMIGDVLLLSTIDGYGLHTSIPWTAVFAAAFRATIATAPAVAIQTWISARFKGFAAPLGIALGAVVIGFMLLSLRGEEQLIAYYPWTLPMATIDSSDPKVDTALPMWIGLIGGLVIGAIVCWDLARRNDVE